jgi:dihydropteroate synthase
MNPSSNSTLWGSVWRGTPLRSWKIRQTLFGGNRPLIMGILNCTPDSFFDGGKYQSVDSALHQTEKMVKDGVDIIDVGGESTRPGAPAVSLEEELRRVEPVVEAIAKRFEVPISIDTSKAEVARSSCERGAAIVNDVSGLGEGEAMISVLLDTGASYVLTHTQGTPKNMQDKPEYADVVQEVSLELSQKKQLLVHRGIEECKIALDPGIGFGKELHHNYELLQNIEMLGHLESPILLGLSRKSFIGKTPGLEESDRLQPSLAMALVCGLKGASILRVHDIRETWEQLRIVEAVFSEKK